MICANVRDWEDVKSFPVDTLTFCHYSNRENADFQPLRRR